ncbi:MAG: RluA family pseudouridine synthase [Candidatus Moranbacteria bacterium]|nr:RluA family pseudouridine synthase [Candidatus Moranbacteria bacterium]
MALTQDRKIYTVKHRDEGVRLDHFLALSLQKDNLDGFSRAMIAGLIRSGQVVHNGEIATKPDKKILMNDVISLESPSFQPDQSESEFQAHTGVDPDILYEDEMVLFVNKPAGLLTHAVRENDMSLVSWIQRHYPQVVQVGGTPLRPGIVHRLDKETSGVLVIAKTPAAFTELKRLFKEREIEKTYFAFVEGHLSKTSGSIDFPITRIPHSEKRSIRRATSDVEARSALTHYRLLKRFSEGDLVEVRPRTGRTHQIRIHFSAIQHPIVGDRLYGFRRKTNTLVAPRQMLHAGRLVFSLFGKMYDVEAPLSDDFSRLLAGLTACE